jgi:hypothetical protein
VEEKDPYKILGVERDASDDEIKKAWHRLAKQHHSDVTGEEDDAMAEINGAYAILSDPDRRTAYDATGSSDVRSREDIETRHTFFKICELMLFQTSTASVHKALKEYLDSAENKYEQDKNALSDKKQKVLAVRSRIQRAPDPDLIGGLIAQKLEQLDADDAELDFWIDIDRRAVDMFSGYTFIELIDTSIAFSGRRDQATQMNDIIASAIQAFNSSLRSGHA